MYFQKIIVYKIPPGGGRGVYSQLKAYLYQLNAFKPPPPVA